jgi:hypothetical protein
MPHLGQGSLHISIEMTAEGSVDSGHADILAHDEPILAARDESTIK